MSKHSLKFKKKALNKKLQNYRMENESPQNWSRFRFNKFIGVKFKSSLSLSLLKLKVSDSVRVVLEQPVFTGFCLEDPG